MILRQAERSGSTERASSRAAEARQGLSGPLIDLLERRGGPKAASAQLLLYSLTTCSLTPLSLPLQHQLLGRAIVAGSEPAEVDAVGETATKVVTTIPSDAVPTGLLLRANKDPDLATGEVVD